MQQKPDLSQPKSFVSTLPQVMVCIKLTTKTLDESNFKDATCQLFAVGFEQVSDSLIVLTVTRWSILVPCSINSTTQVLIINTTFNFIPLCTIE